MVQSVIAVTEEENDQEETQNDGNFRDIATIRLTRVNWRSVRCARTALRVIAPRGAIVAGAVYNTDDDLTGPDRTGPPERLKDGQALLA